jgi:hypothetical protein
LKADDHDCTQTRIILALNSNGTHDVTTDVLREFFAALSSGRDVTFQGGLCGAYEHLGGWLAANGSIGGRTIVAKAVRKDHSGWSFFQFRTFVAYKAHIAGIPVSRTLRAKVARAAALLVRTGQGLRL